jgi:hypothetical protein
VNWCVAKTGVELLEQLVHDDLPMFVESFHSGHWDQGEGITATDSFAAPVVTLVDPNTTLVDPHTRDPPGLKLVSHDIAPQGFDDDSTFTDGFGTSDFDENFAIFECDDASSDASDAFFVNFEFDCDDCNALVIFDNDDASDLGCFNQGGSATVAARNTMTVEFIEAPALVFDLHQKFDSWMWFNPGGSSLPGIPLDQSTSSSLAIRAPTRMLSEEATASSDLVMGGKHLSQPAPLITMDTEISSWILVNYDETSKEIVNP